MTRHHVYVSVGHGQMMTDAMKPLGLSVHQLVALPRMYAGRRTVVRRRRAAPGARRRAAPPSWRPSGPPIRSSGTRCRPSSTAVTSSSRSPTTATPRAAAGRPAGPDRDRSGHRLRADPAHRGVRRRLPARHRDAVGAGAVRLHPGRHRGAEAAAVRPGEPSGDHGRDGGHVVAQRPPGGVAGRDERGRHADAVRSRERHLGDGAGAAGRRRRDPPPSGRRGLPARRRGRGLPRRDGRAARGSRARDAIRAYLDTYGMRCVGEIDITRPRWSERPTTLVPHHPRQRRQLRAGRRSAAVRAGAPGGGRRRNRSCSSACGPCRTGSARPRRSSG